MEETNMNQEKKDCTIHFRCSKDQKKLIIKNAKESGSPTKSEYCLNCCLYGTSDNSQKTLASLLSQLESLFIRLENGTMKRKEFIKEIKQEMEYAWSTLR